jgi:hypothetical protein
MRGRVTNPLLWKIVFLVGFLSAQTKRFRRHEFDTRRYYISGSSLIFQIGAADLPVCLRVVRYLTYLLPYPIGDLGLEKPPRDPDFYKPSYLTA